MNLLLNYFPIRIPNFNIAFEVLGLSLLLYNIMHAFIYIVLPTLPLSFLCITVAPVAFASGA